MRASGQCPAPPAADPEGLRCQGLKTHSRLGFGGARGMVGGADWASNWGAGEAPRVCVSEVMLRRVARAGDGVRAAGRAGEGGVGTTAREPAGWCAATLRTYTLVAYTSADVRDFFLGFCVRTTFCSGGSAGGKSRFSKFSFSSGSRHG